MHIQYVYMLPVKFNKNLFLAVYVLYNIILMEEYSYLVQGMLKWLYLFAKLSNAYVYSLNLHS